MTASKYLISIPLLYSISLSAAPFTDTGSIYQQIKQNQIEKEQRSQQRNELQTRKKIIDTHKQTEKTFFVKKILVLNNIDLSLKKQNEVLSPYENRNLSLTDIAEAAKALEQAHLDHGDLTVAVDVNLDKIYEGIVAFSLSGGVLEKKGISVDNKSEHIKTEKVENLVNNILKPGLMTKSAYERALLLSNDLAGISVKGDLYLGEVDGTNDLVVTITDADNFTGNIDIDNFGSYYTGQIQLGTTLYWNSPTKNGEEIVARFITTGEHSNFGYLNLAVPVFDNGMRIGASIDFLTYSLDEKRANTKGDGNVWNARAYVKYPIVRTEAMNVETELAYDHRALKDNGMGIEIDNSTIDRAYLTISGNKSDSFLENGINYFSATVTRGNVNLKNQTFKEADSKFFQTQGYFTKLNYSLSRLQNIKGSLSSKISIEGQWANKNLDTSEKSFLGGPYGVSAYPVGTVSGDVTEVLSVDLRYDFYEMPWGGDFQIKAFYTYGHAKIFKDPEALQRIFPGNPEYKENNNIYLQSIGLGFSQTWSATSVVRVTVGKQIGNDKHLLRQVTLPLGEDYDHSSSDYRAWVEAIYYF